jgi:hypothetical protein
MSTIFVHVPFKKSMAKTPTLTAYSTSPAINAVRDSTSAVDRAVSSFFGTATNGFSGVTTSTATVGAARIDFHYTADTGW